MAASVLKALSLLTAAGTLAGIAYTTLALTRIRLFRTNARERPARSSTPVTVLKPLYGEEPGLFEHLSSFCDQNYPAYQIIFGAARPDDPALEVARSVARRFPDRDITIVSGDAHHAANPKIGNLLGMIGKARHPLILIADSDIAVDRQYLHAVAACFNDPRVGAATCIYGAVPGPGLAARMGAMHVNDQFAPSVLVATALEPLTYCFGATMAVRGDVLSHIGGLEALAGYLADDYLLGKLVSDANYRVALVPYAVQTTAADETFGALWRHEVRWARTIAGQRAAGYAGSIVTYVLPWAAVFAALSPGPVSLGALVLAIALRTALHFEARAAFAPQTRATPWLIPLRDIFGVAVWSASFLGKRVRWKQGTYEIGPAGRMAVDPDEV